MSAHENINPQGETLKLETRDNTKHSLGPTKRRKQQTMNLELWSKPLFFSPVRYVIYSYCISFFPELSFVFTTAPLHECRPLWFAESVYFLFLRLDGELLMDGDHDDHVTIGNLLASTIKRLFYFQEPLLSR